MLLCVVFIYSFTLFYMVCKRIVRNDMLCPFCIGHHIGVDVLVLFIKLNIDHFFLAIKFFETNFSISTPSD